MSNPNILLANRRFINNPSTAVTESLFGLVCSNRNLAFLDYNKVIVRRDYLDVDTVKIVSGMGSGHEPAFAGFVGKGMLTAAIQGKCTSLLYNHITKLWVLYTYVSFT